MLMAAPPATADPQPCGLWFFGWLQSTFRFYDGQRLFTTIRVDFSVETAFSNNHPFGRFKNFLGRTLHILPVARLRKYLETIGVAEYAPRVVFCDRNSGIQAGEDNPLSAEGEFNFCLVLLLPIACSQLVDNIILQVQDSFAAVPPATLIFTFVVHFSTAYHLSNSILYSVQIDNNMVCSSLAALDFSDGDILRTDWQDCFFTENPAFLVLSHSA